MRKFELHESKRLNESYYSFIHESGLPVLVCPKAFSTTNAVFATDFGSIHNRFRFANEPEYTEVPDGVAHFLEHKLFESDTGEETFARFGRTGAEANAFTSFTQTAYVFSATENVIPSLEILLDFVTHPYFTDENVAKEQGIIGQELRMYEDNPGTGLYYGMLGCLYEKHKVATNIGGTIDSIARITPEILYRCYRTFYHPSNMALAVCGNADPDQVLELVDKYVKADPVPEILRDIPDESPDACKPHFEKRYPIAKPVFLIGIKDTAIPTDHRERIRKALTVDILNEVLFGRSSAFFSELYTSGLISMEFGASYESHSSFSFNGISGESADPDEVYRRILAYTEQIAHDGFSREDFERIRRTVYASMLRSFDSTEEIANSLIGAAFTGIDLYTQTELISEVSYESAIDVFRSLFRPSAFAISIIRPIGG